MSTEQTRDVLYLYQDERNRAVAAFNTADQQLLSAVAAYDAVVDRNRHSSSYVSDTAERAAVEGATTRRARAYERMVEAQQKLEDLLA